METVSRGWKGERVKEMILLLKQNPTLQMVSEIRPPIRIKKLLPLLHNPKELHRQVRRIQILEYAARQAKRTQEEKAADYQDIDECQNRWIEARMRGSAKSWKRWDGTIEEWSPWSWIDGEAINIWREYKK